MRDGGSYLIGETGKPELRQRTEAHPEGDRPRAADGTPAYARAGDVAPDVKKASAAKPSPTKAPSKEA